MHRDGVAHLVTHLGDIGVGRLGHLNAGLHQVHQGRVSVAHLNGRCVKHVLVGRRHHVHQRVRVIRLDGVSKVVTLLFAFRQDGIEVNRQVTQHRVHNADQIEVTVSGVFHADGVYDLVALLGDFGVDCLGNLNGRYKHHQRP